MLVPDTDLQPGWSQKRRKCMTARGLPARSGSLVFILIIILVSCSSGSPVVSPKHTPTPGLDFPSPAPTEISSAPQNCPRTSPLPDTKVFPAGWGGYLVNTTLYVVKLRCGAIFLPICKLALFPIITIPGQAPRCCGKSARR